MISFSLVLFLVTFVLHIFLSTFSLFHPNFLCSPRFHDPDLLLGLRVVLDDLWISPARDEAAPHRVPRAAQRLTLLVDFGQRSARRVVPELDVARGI